jgi:hypothetical protein
MASCRAEAAWDCKRRKAGGMSTEQVKAGDRFELSRVDGGKDVYRVTHVGQDDVAYMHLEGGVVSELIFAHELVTNDSWRRVEPASASPAPPVDPWAEHLAAEAIIRDKTAAINFDRALGVFYLTERPVCAPPEPMASGLGSMCRMTGVVNRWYR